MSNSASVQIAVGKRLTIVDKIGESGSGADGQSLRGQNVNDYPDAALFFVRNSNRFYKLKKNMAIAIAEDVTGNDNVINGIGSSPDAGRFVAVLQMANLQLVANESGSTASVAGFDLTAFGNFHVSYATPGGTQGFLTPSIATETTMTVVSSSVADTSFVFVTYYEASQSE